MIEADHEDRKGGVLGVQEPAEVGRVIEGRAEAGLGRAGVNKAGQALELDGIEVENRCPGGMSAGRSAASPGMTSKPTKGHTFETLAGNPFTNRRGAAECVEHDGHRPDQTLPARTKPARIVSRRK